MTRHRPHSLNRRSLLAGLTTLPVFLPHAMAEPLSSADQVLNVMDFEPLARAALPPAHFAYMATGVDDDRTVTRNHEAFSHYEIRAHRFNDLRRLSTAQTVFGNSWPSPIYLSAVASQRAFHPEGELGSARAAGSRSMQMMLSTGTSIAVEAVSAARAAPLWQQLYPTDDWAVTEALVRRAEKAGCTAIALTVDSPGARNMETLERATRIDTRQCTACHAGGKHQMWRDRPMFAGLDVSRVTSVTRLDMTPAFLARLRSLVKGKLIIKGIVTGEDAAIALDNGADGIVVSNHGGRNEETLRATIDCLPEVVAAVKGRAAVFLDGGIRRGTDIFKALALGVTAVGIGRPQVWGLAAFGQSGVERVIDILNSELANIMRQAGTPTVASITPAQVLRSAGA